MPLQNHELYNLFIAGDVEECLERIAERLVAAGGQQPTDIYPLHLKGLILRQQGKLNESLECFQDAVEVQPDDFSSLRQVARTLLLLRQYKKALSIYEDFTRKAGIDAEVMCDTGRCYSRLEKHSKALECFDKAITTRPQSAMFMEMCEEQLKIGKVDAAVEACLEGLRRCGHSPALLSKLGIVYLRKGDDKRAFKALMDAQACGSKDQAATFALACLKQDKGGLADANELYRRLLEDDDSAETWNNAGLCLLGQQRSQCAVSCLKKALNANPFDWRVHCNLGLCCLRAGQTSVAIVHLKASVGLDRKQGQVWMWLGVALALIGDGNNARQAFRNALKLEDSPETHLRYAALLWNSGDRQEAKKHFERYHSQRTDHQTKHLPEYDALQAQLFA